MRGHVAVGQDGLQLFQEEGPRVIRHLGGQCPFALELTAGRVGAHPQPLSGGPVGSLYRLYILPHSLPWNWDSKVRAERSVTGLPTVANLGVIVFESLTQSPLPFIPSLPV